MVKEDISIKFLLHLVGERPAVWDKTSEAFKDRQLKENSWREISALVNENYYSLESSARSEFTKIIIKKWGHVRDSWVKSMKHGYDEDTKLPPKPYVYHNELKFMQKNLKCKPHRFDLKPCLPNNSYYQEFYRGPNETVNSHAALQDMEYDNESDHKNLTDIALNPGININKNEKKLSEAEESDEWHLPEEEQDEKTESVKKKRTSIFVTARDNENNHLEQKVSPTFLSKIMPTHSKAKIDSSNLLKADDNLIEQRHWNFLRGIFPSIVSLDEDHTLQFQLGIISLLQKLRESQKQKQKSNRLSSQSLSKGRGRKRKASLDDDDDERATNSNYPRQKSSRQKLDPIAPDCEESITEYSSN